MARVVQSQQAAAALDPVHAARTMAAALRLAKHGDAARAATLLEQLLATPGIQKFEHAWRVFVERARLAERGDPERAVALASAALALEPKQGVSHTLLARIARRRGDECEAALHALCACVVAMLRRDDAHAGAMCRAASALCAPRAPLLAAVWQAAALVRKGQLAEARMGLNRAQQLLSMQPSVVLPWWQQAREAAARLTQRAAADQAPPRLPTRLLFLYPALDAQRILDAHFALMAQAVDRLPHLSLQRRAVLTEPVLRTWDATAAAMLATLASSAIDSILPRQAVSEPDAMLVFDRCCGQGRQSLPPLSVPPHVPTIRWEDECGMGQCTECVQQSDVFAFAYEQDMRLYRKLLPGRVFVHSPQPADPAAFAEASAPLQDAHRPITVILTGEADALFPGRDGQWYPQYPLRRRLRRLLRSGAVAGWVVRAHPGYTQFACHSAAECTAANVSAATTTAERAAYAAQLGQARIVLVTASAWRYWLRKYAEAALAGALVMGDVPQGMSHPLLTYVTAPRAPQPSFALRRWARVRVRALPP